MMGLSASAPHGIDGESSERRRCPCCDGTTFVSDDGAPAEGPFAVARCATCGLGVTTPLPGPAELESFYPAAYYGAGGARYRPAAERLAAAFRRARGAWIARLRPPGRVLDVGCGHGYMLTALRARGWDVLGVELHAAAASYARDVLGLPVAVGELGALDLPAASFDVIVFWQSFEHLRDPLEKLREAVRLLVPGGLVLVSVPNRASWQARWARTAWFHWELPRHLYHYDPRTLAALFARSGLAVVGESHANWEQNPFGWLQSIQNRLGLPQNALFRGMWAGPAAAPRTAAWHRLLAVPLLPLSLALAALETTARRGGTVLLVGRKATA